MITRQTLRFNEIGQATKNEYASTPPAIVADVLFGSPRNNCAGSGICQVVGPVASEMLDQNRWNCKRSVALIRVLNEHKAAFHFVKNSMCSKIESTYFRDHFFVVDQEAEMKLNSWSEKSYWIMPGIYQYMRQGHFYTMVLNIKPMKLSR